MAKYGNHRLKVCWILLFLISCGKNRVVELRKFPYPFISALSIASDVDKTETKEEFLEIMKFLNTETITAMGKGVGLEVGYSFWVYDGYGDTEFTLFRGTSFEPSESAGVIEDFIRAGFIDYIHTYGEFSKGGFRREFAKKAIDYLKRRGLRVEVWVNHGGESNTQQIGPLPHQRGDNPGAEEYHTDLLLSYGVRFIGRYEITHVVGQDAGCSLLDRLKQIYEVFKYGFKTGDWRWGSILSNRLIYPCRLDDGSTFYSFKRFISRSGKLSRTGSKELAEQISKSILDELERKRGYMIVYTHLGDNPGYPDYIPPKTREALRYLADEYKGGRIYVTTTEKLLMYNLVHNYLDWTAYKWGNLIYIFIWGVKDPLRGYFIPTQKQLQGITFYTPSPDSTFIFIRSKRIRNISKNGPDETGRKSVSIPLHHLKFPSKYIEED
jgi:hypothetical protein